MIKLLLVALGGALGSVFRFILTAAIPKSLGKTFLWGTLSVNIIGSLIIGILWAYFENSTDNQNVRIFLIVGILGGFTTYSSFALESINLFRNGDFRMAILYIFGTNVFGMLAAFGGYYLSKQLLTI
jgi:CrcB protein